MRPYFVKTAITLVIAASVNLPEAFAADWNGSYSAQGQCFCAGKLPSATRSTIVPTPVGGQTVAQVCQRLGAGPGLTRISGLFNHPVYEDAQCGNGPGLPASKVTSTRCSGSFDGVGADNATCFPAGPHWDLQTAFSRVKVPAAASLQVQGRPASIPGVLGAPMKASNSKSVSGISDKAPVEAAVSKPPEGTQWVVIDGHRFVRARKGIPAAGGATGQRIILDGQVYLRDDGKLDPAELYQESTNEKPVVSADRDKSEDAARTISANKEAARKAANERERASAQRSQALQKQADARATARQIEVQRRMQRQRVLEEQASAAKALDTGDVDELNLAKERLEAESAKRARVVLEAYVEAQMAREAQANAQLAREAQLARDDGERDSRAGPDEAEPVVAAATPEVGLESSEQAVTEVSRQVIAPSTGDHETGPYQTQDSAAAPSVSSAMRLPPTTRASSRNFRYLEALPVNYDVGGNGVMLEGSTSSHSRLQYFGRLGVTEQYSEFMAGGGYYLTPESASRLTFILLAGIEYGNFELVDGQSSEISVDYDDSGVYLAASSRVVVNNRFELKAGVGYSSIFEGDAMIFGGGYLHLTRKLDLITRFELGDNDLLGIGVRYYY